MEELMNQYLMTMKARNFAQSTIDACCRELQAYLKHVGKNPHDVVADDVTKYQVMFLEKSSSADEGQSSRAKSWDG